MVSRSQYDTHKPKELRRLYEPLAVLYELTMTDATKPRSNFSTSAHGISIMERRRNFVDAIAFIGAYRKECEIAVAVERQPDGLIVRVAGTGDIDRIVVPFLNELLHQLSNIVNLPKDEIEGDKKKRILSSLSDIAVEFAKEKVFAHYMKLLHDIAPVCLADMATGLNGTWNYCLALIHIESTDMSMEAHVASVDFNAWFQKNFYRNGAPLTQEHMRPLAKECFNASQSKLFDPPGRFIYHGHEHAAHFEKFYKQLRKLSRTIDMTSQLFESAISLRQDLANDLAVQSIPSSPHLPIPLLPRKLTIEGIAGRIFSDPSKMDGFRQKLEVIAPPGLTQALKHYSKTVLTEVHPELLVVNYFDTLLDGGFIDEGDKYIGCTKPGCYLCRLFISYHPARYSMISSSSRICLNWRLPDISHEECNAMARAENQKYVLRKLINTIRIQLEEKVDNQWALQPHCTESETECTPPVHEDTFSYSSQPSSLELTPDYPAASTEPFTTEFDTGSDETSGAGKSADQDTEDVVLFKGRCRF